MPLGDTARIGDEGKAAERTAPAALLSELSKEQKRHFVLAVTGSGTASHNLHLALDRPPSGCERLSPDFVPVGAFLRDTPKIRFISTKSTEPIRPAAAIVPESGCAVAKDRAGVASQRGDAPAPTTRTMLSKARTGEKAEPPVASFPWGSENFALQRGGRNPVWCSFLSFARSSVARDPGGAFHLNSKHERANRTLRRSGILSSG